MEGLEGGLMRHKMMINEFMAAAHQTRAGELGFAPVAWRRRSTQLGFGLPGLSAHRVSPRTHHGPGRFP